MADDAGNDATAKMVNLSLSPKYIRLISVDGHAFIVQQEVAFISPTIVTLMNGPAQADDECHLTRIPSHLLSIVVRYLHYKKHCPSVAWPDCTPPPALNIPPHLRVDSTHAADFLGLVRHVGPSDYIRLKSADGHIFIVKKEIALQSDRIGDMMRRSSNGDVNCRELELDFVEPFLECYRGSRRRRALLPLERPLEVISSCNLLLVVNYMIDKQQLRDIHINHWHLFYYAKSFFYL